MLDPFCGSGTTMVEGRIAGLDVFGFDINPAARLISKVKSSNYDPRGLLEFESYLVKELENLDIPSYEESVRVSGFRPKRVKTWFARESVKEIAAILNLVNESDFETEYKDLGRVILSDCLRSVGNQRLGEFKLYRQEGFLAGDLKKGKDIGDLYKPLFPIFESKLRNGIEGAIALSAKVEGSQRMTETSVSDTDSSIVLISPRLRRRIRPRGDFPPYGDSETTVAYSQFSWFSNVWLGLGDTSPSQLDSEMMGGRSNQSLKIEKFGCRSIDKSIREMDDVMAMKSFLFYRDYLKSIRNVSKNVKRGGFVVTWSAIGSLEDSI